MPISSTDSCSEEHWRDVKNILSEAIEDADFTPQLVSDADDVGIIQKRIIQNLYENPIVVCDVSAKNPNVMFELGLRLAFDRPTIVVKDDKTTYSFDTSPIEHLTYPRDLRFSRIVEFKELLCEKIKATYEKSVTDPNYTTFLKNFGTFKVAELKTELIPKDMLVLEEVKNLRELVLSLNTNNRTTVTHEFLPRNSGARRTLCLQETSKEIATTFMKWAVENDLDIKQVSGTSVSQASSKHTHFLTNLPNPADRVKVLQFARGLVPEARWIGAITKIVR